MATDVVCVEDQNKQLVTDFLEAFSSGDVDRTLSFLSETATWWVAGTMEGISGTMDKESFRKTLAGQSAFTKAGVQLTPKAWTAQGDRVAVETESYSELKNGRVYNNLYHFLFVVRDGKIEAAKEYLDTEHARATWLAP